MSSEQSGSEPVMRVRQVGKCYHLYARPQDRLRQALSRWRKQYFREFWALRNVSFDLHRGECLGVIGRNGAGKSTLLQLIAGTVTPTEGTIEIRGKVTALLELGGGFNPEFTGRENVFLQGAVLGIPREEMEGRFGEIAEFADIGSFIDQPVKLYSTGMFMRLAFAIQVVLRPDILIVDEALAVGDAGFQIKCFNRMRQLREHGTSIVLVTHDVVTVRSMCDRALWLHEGQLQLAGDPNHVTSRYMEFLSSGTCRQFGSQVLSGADGKRSSDMAGDSVSFPNGGELSSRPLLPIVDRPGLIRWGSGQLRIRSAAIHNGGDPVPEPIFEHGDRLHVELEITALEPVSSEHVGAGIAFRNSKGLDIITVTTYEEGIRFPPWEAGQVRRVSIELENILAAGPYALVLNVEDRRHTPCHYYDFIENTLVFHVCSSKKIYSVVHPRVRVSVCQVSEVPCSV